MDWGQTLYIKISSSLLGLLGHSTFRFEEVVGVKDHMQEMVSNFFVNPNPFTYSFLVVWVF
jgi:hypothetical protein